MTRLGAHGFNLELPRGWEGRIVRRVAANPAEQTRAVVHAASFPLPEERGDFGVGVTELMRPGDAFVTLFEYGPESVGKPLFAAAGMPELTATMFSARRLQRTLPGQIGCQTFFTAARRPFCLYVVVAGPVHLAGAITKVNAMLHTLELYAVTFSERVVSTVSKGLARKASRRSFLFRAAVVGSALALNPWRFLLRPGTAYASLCGPDAGCDSGWTVFCCSINEGRNACPPGTIPAGWWKTDASGFCEGGPRYILDCNATCGSCTCGPDGICDPGCYSCNCHCGTGSCDERFVCCNQFRYGQCHQELACVGPVVCRVASCRPPWEIDPTCTTASATANATALHTAPCLDDDTNAFATAFGGAPTLGAPAGQLAAGLVGIAATPSGKGYWLVASDGGIFSYGDARFHGSTGGTHLNAPIVGMAATTTGNGYWLVASDGGIFSYGDARFHGSTGGIHLNAPIVGMAAAPSGGGYWLVASDGGIFAFGGTHFFGSTGDIRLNAPIVGMAATPSGRGYWLVASDGGIFTFGDAHFFGSTGGIRLNQPIVGMAATPSGRGYWFVAADGGVFTYGDAHYFGGLGGSDGARGETFGIARSGAHGYWLASQR